jgi:hypothetical protein
MKSIKIFFIIIFFFSIGLQTFSVKRMRLNRSFDMAYSSVQTTAAVKEYY